VYQDILLELDKGLDQILREHARRGWFVARPEPSKGIGCLVVSLEDMMKLKTVKFFPLASLPLVGTPRCGSHNSLTLQLLD
jgi:hypothetical protein